ncbi:MAG: UvrD-helicase domain-containing protein [Treponema sp.]|nr:UvrD-helicase domain-containing protein [Candidatus Treponema equifaecale]
MTNNKYEANEQFFKLLKYEPDSAQLEALKMNKNGVIAAGAGSGKTQVLAIRFAWLIMTGQAKVDQILTLTFTNKAASEMYQRIYETLTFFADHEKCPEISEKQQQLARDALNNFADARIQTLDSYCGGILRQCANRYGIRPDFSAGSGGGQAKTKTEALKFVLENAENKGISFFTEPGKLQNFAENIFADAISRTTSLASPENFFVSSLEKQKQKILECWNYLVTGKNKPKELDDLGIFALKNLISAVEANYEEACAAGKSKGEYVQRVKKALDYYSSEEFELEGMTAQSFEEIPLKNVEKITHLIELFSFGNPAGYTANLRSAVKAIREQSYDLIFTFILQYENILALNQLMDAFLVKTNEEKRITGQISFNDITEMALKALLENEDLRNQEKNAYKKIMIDEFQDNNGKNRDLLYLISLKPGEFEDNGHCKIQTDSVSLHDQIILRDKEGNIVEDKRSPDKLFFVGDEKQSIYKFRGAEVSVFNELTAGGENELSAMTYNYRSTPELVKAFNLLFKNGGGIFDSFTEENRLDYEAYYQKDALKKDMELPDLDEENVPIHAKLFDEDLIAENEELPLAQQLNLIPKKEQVAFYIARHIWENGKDSQNWGDFAILDRRRTDRNLLTKYLSFFNIPYQVDQLNNIFDDGLVNDFYNFLRICVYPSDSTAFAAYLCSPFCGLSENSMETVLAHLTSSTLGYDFIFDPFADLDQEIQSDLSETEFNKFQNGRNFFREMKDKVLKQKLTTSLSQLWNERGYKYETMLSDQVQLKSEQFDMLFEMARTADEEGNSISWFIDELAGLKDGAGSDIDTDVNYPLERSQAVQIMTIHKSKGLQFSHVYIYGCVNVYKGNFGSSWYFDDKYGFSIKPDFDTPNFFAKIQSQMEANKELAEFRRLFYVAVTRAENDAYIVGTWNKAKEDGRYLQLVDGTVARYYGEENPDEDGEESTNVRYAENAPFDFEEISPVTYEELRNFNQQTTTATQAKEQILSTAGALYENANLIEHKCNPIPRMTPSGLEERTAAATTVEQADDEDKILEAKSMNEEKPLTSSKFNAGDFGTLVHAYLEAQANSVPAEEFEAPVSMFKDLNEKEIAENKARCVEFCHKFAATACGKALEDAKKSGRFHRAEWEFKMLLNGTIFRGSIDLIYENSDGTFTIVDYKSDNEVHPEIYTGQQNCYREAASKLLGTDTKKISCQLYFMKHDSFVQVN